MINPLLLVAATNPMRRIATFMGFVALVLAAPLVYGGWDSDVAARAISSLVIWGGLAFLVFLMMSSIRVQRLTSRRDSQMTTRDASFITGTAGRSAPDAGTARVSRRASRSPCTRATRGGTA